MERRGDLSFGFTLTDSATETYRLAPRNESSNLFGGPTQPVPIRTPLAPVPTPVPAPTAAALSAIVASPVSGVAGSSTTTDGKKKRGRPRKYGPDGKLTMPLCPMPISSSVPLTGDFSASKRGRGRSNDMTKKSHKLDTYKLEPEGSGGKIAYYVGANFTPHVITVNDGEDVTMKIMLFSQQEPRAVCIISANGIVSNVTLRQPTLAGGTLTYEGRFEILTLSGSFMPTVNGGHRGMCGGMSVSLIGQDGRVLGGGLAGLLVAEGPVQVMVGSFLQGHQQEHKPRKNKTEAVVNGGVEPIVSPINGANSGPANPTQEGQGRSPTDDEDMSSSGEVSQDHSQSN